MPTAEKKDLRKVIKKLVTPPIVCHTLCNMKLNMKTAKLIQDNLKGFNGHAALYQVNPPMAASTWDGPDAPSKMHDFVVVSSARVLGTPETYIFPASNKGKVLDWIEMAGSARGIYSHDAVLANAGYDVVR